MSIDSAQTLDLAVKQHQAGNLREAEQLYRQILQAEPGHADALHLLGVIAHQVGRHELAVEHIRRALRVRPNFAEARCNLGAALQALGHLDEAVASYRQAVQLKPDYAEAHNNLGNALRLQDKPAEAAASLQQAPRLRPGYAGALSNLGLALQKLGRLDEAVAHFEKALRSSPNHAETHLNLGVARQEQGKLDEAVASFEQALGLKPNYVEAHYNLAGVFKIQGKLAEAVASYERALSLKPDYAEAHNNLGTAFLEQRRLDEAAASFRQALGCKPDFSEAHANLGGVLNVQGKQAEAAASCEQALHFKPDNAEALAILGNVLKDQGKLVYALASYERAVLLKPDHVKNHVSRALIWLLQGDFEKGWAEYEWRFRSPDTSPQRLPQPLWQGEPLAGRTILLHAEQGLGDTLQFVRYVALVRTHGAGSVLLQCQAPLVRLLANCADRVVPQGEPLPDFDVHAPFLSLPRLLGTTSLERIPADIPYLRCDPELVEQWRKKIADCGLRIADSNASGLDLNPQSAIRNPQWNVGIAWQGNPDHKGDRWRSVPLERFAPLSAVPGVTLISLQKGPGSEQLAALPGLVDLGRELTDFADTAAALRGLDLVITVDTALAHLAGSLGVAAWVALPFAPDWRWLVEREDSPWYPSLRLFRQSRFGEWDDVFGRIRNALEDVVCGRGPVISQKTAPPRDKKQAGQKDFSPAPAIAQGPTVSQEDARKRETPPAEQKDFASSSFGLLQKLELAVQHQNAGDLWQAQKLYEQILQADPRHAEAHQNLGLALRGQGLMEEAAASFRQALLLKPDFLAAHVNLGSALGQLGRLEEAAANFRQVLLSKPDCAEAHYNLGLIFLAQGQLPQALDCYDRAIDFKEDYVSAHWNRSLLWLLHCDLQRGFAEFEWRWRRPETPPRPFPQPLWQGETLPGRTILLHAEQGLGDTLQFVRYASLVKERSGAIVLLECQPSLLRLLGQAGPCSLGVDALVAKGETLPPFDVHAPLLSLPRLLGTTSLERIPAGVPYLSSDPGLVLHWRKRLESVSGFRIGIAWQGSPANREDQRRSVSLERFAPISRLPGVRLISLQKGPGTEQLADLPGLVDLGPELTDFADTAAVLRSLDLVVTVDTALAHLAGALGIETWVALPFVPDWRWLLEREDSPWYPTMRLFRQQRLGEWDEVFERIAAAVAARKPCVSDSLSE